MSDNGVSTAILRPSRTKHGL